MPSINSLPINHHDPNIVTSGKGELRIEYLDEANNSIGITAKYKNESKLEPGFFIAPILIFDLDAFKIWISQCHRELNK